MTKVMSTLDTVNIGEQFFGISSGERYTKLSKTHVRSEEGVDKGTVWEWGQYTRVFVEIDFQK